MTEMERLIYVILIYGLNIYTFDGNPNSPTPRKVSTNSALSRSKLENRDILFGEFNGDGLVDILLSPSAVTKSDYVWTLYNSNGLGFFEKKAFTATSKTNSDKVGFMIQDINGDGISDLINYSETGFNTYFFYDNSFKNKLFFTSTPCEESILITTDINTRNSFIHLLCVKDDIVTKFKFSRDDHKESLLTGMANSLGLVETVEYNYINAEGVVNEIYIRGNNAEFPYVSILEPLPVVTMNQTLLNGDIIDTSSYIYYNGIINRQGKGFCGFEKIIKNDNRGRLVTQSFDPYNFSVLKSETSPLSEKHYSYNISLASDKRVKIKPASLIESDKLTGVSIDISYKHNAYGYPREETKLYSDGTKVITTTAYLSKSNIGDWYNLETPANRSVTVESNESTYKLTEKHLYLSKNPKGVYLYKDDNRVKFLSLTYDSIGNILQKSEKLYSSSNSLQTNYNYDSFSRLTMETDPLGFTTVYSYDYMGRLSGVRDKRGNNTTYAYDSFGREKTVTHTDGTCSTTQYQWTDEGVGGLYAVTKSSTGQPVKTIIYDALGREVRNTETRFDGSKVKVDKIYDVSGNLLKESLPFKGEEASLWRTFSYDTYDRLISITEPSERKTIYDYTANSVTTETDGISTTREYDALGNMISVTDPGGTVSYNLHADGQAVEIIAPGDIRTTFTYDKYRRLSSLGDPSIGDRLYSYDDNGNLCSLHQGGLVATEISPVESGNMGSDIDGTLIFCTEYDKYNRLIKKSTPHFSTEYTYGPYGDLIKILSDNGTSISNSYDSYGRLSSQRENGVDNIWLQRDYTYADGNISSIKYSTQSGLSITENYTYSNGYVKTVKTDESTVVYDLKEECDLGLPSKINTGSFERYYTYTSSGLPLSRRASNGQPILDLSYVFDPLTHNLISRTDNLKKRTESFSYDNLNRLTAYSDNTAEYDNKGNIVEKSDVGSFEYSISDKPYAISKVDLTGNAVSTCTQTIAYTSFARPDSIAENGYKAKFTYNGDFDRVKMELSYNDSVMMRRYYLGGCYEYELRGSIEMERIYLFGGYYDAPVVAIRNKTARLTAYVFRDYDGSIISLMSHSNLRLHNVSYDAWGRLLRNDTLKPFAPGNSSALLLGRGYTGHEHLIPFGLINMNARLYDPALGRFLSPDPYIQMPDFSQNFNRYSYALNNPLRFVDENGEFFWAVVGIAAGISAIVNVATHWKEIKAAGGWNGFWKGAGYALTGALAGAAGATAGVAAAVGFGGMLGVSATALTSASTGFYAGASIGIANGLTSGFILGTSNSLLEGNSLGAALNKGIFDAACGGLMGGITGGLGGGVQALNEGKNFWTGRTPTVAYNNININNSVTTSTVNDNNTYTYSVYEGIDTQKEVRYVGITSRDPQIRFREHLLSGTNRSGLFYGVIENTGDLSRMQARIWEQNLINQYGLMKNGGQLFNLRNEISPKYWIKFNIKF